VRRKDPCAQQTDARTCIETDTGSYPNVYDDRRTRGHQLSAFSPLVSDLWMVGCQSPECPLSLQLGERAVAVRRWWSVTAEYP